MKWLRRGRSRCFQGQTGLTLLEVLVAVGILGFIGVALMTALDTNSRAVRTLDEQVTAANLATAYFEVIRSSVYDNTSPGEYSSVGDNITKPLDYSVDIEVDYSNDGTTWVSSANRTDEKLQRILVSVSRSGKPLLSVCTWRAERF